MTNRRRHPRFVVENLFGKMVFASQVEILNMSLSGVAVKVDRRLNIGTEYALKLELQDKTTQVKGLVVWSMLSDISRTPRGEDVSFYTAGIRFTDALSPALAAILDFIQENKVVPEQRVTGMRFHIQAPGKAILDYPEGYRVKNISRSGMLIETERDLQLEGFVPMQVDLPEGQVLTFEGRVVSSEESLDGDARRFEMGIEFLNMSPEDRARLSQYIDSL
jgi:Tfp pilus assembly protein PilZ